MNQNKMLHDFETYAADILEKYKVPGFSLGVTDNGVPAYEKGFGFRDREKERPLSPDTVFGIGSITKSFTAMAIMQLQEKGKLSVNDPVTKYLPFFKSPGGDGTEHITIHHLLTNSSGLPPMPTLFGALKRSMAHDPTFGDESDEQENPLDALEAIDTHAELMEAIANSEIESLGEPGTEFSYSNEGFSLLGAIIEQISNESYETYVEKNILQPAGMHHSGFTYEDLGTHADIAVLYDMRIEEDEEIVFRSNNPWDAPAMRAAGFLKSTVNDMLTYTEIFQNDGKVGDVAVLSPESVQAMTTPYIQSEPGTYYGYGLMIVPDFFGYKLIQHGGDIKGVTAQMNIIPELKLSAIALTNLAGVPSAKLLNAVCQGFMGKPIDASHANLQVIDLNPDRLTDYEGTYVSGEGTSIEFYIENAKLHFKTAQFPEDALEPISKDMFMFHMREMDFIIRFARNEEKDVHRVVFGFRQIPKVPVASQHEA